jgi:exodeoxyribonuclease V alpha subunit
MPEAKVPPDVDVLTPYVDAGVFGSTEVQLTAAVNRLSGGLDDAVLLAVAVATRGPLLGHTCVALADVDRLMVAIDDDDDDDGDGSALSWPTTASWSAALRASSAVATPDDSGSEPFRPLVFDGRRIYLQRYWEYELSVARDLAERAGAVPEALGMAPSPFDLEQVLDSLFGVPTVDAPDLQRQAVKVAMENQVSVIAGGPGTGKTRTVARLLVAARARADAEGRTLDVALAAPTGKAAAKMTEAVRDQLEEAGQEAELGQGEASTLHRLLGWLPGTHFRHDRENPLPHDLVIVDETSMVPLQLMARLLAALKPSARLVLVGDPFQLASVDAGSVLEDVVGPALLVPTVPTAGSPLAGRVTVLTKMHRFAEHSSISALAQAVRRGDADTAVSLLALEHDDVAWIRPDQTTELRTLRRQVTEAAVEVVTAALSGNAAAGFGAAKGLKVLAATRRGELGMYDWNDRIEAAVAAAVPQVNRFASWYVGRPIIVTANDYVNNLVNGDVGLVVSHEGGARVAVGDGPTLRFLPPSRLDRVETWWAMTIHKSQGSEFTHAVVSLPSAASPILSRELLYTAVTRAKERLTIVATEAALRAAIAHPVARASGLQERLWPAETSDLA